jgi:hypothetical protein
MHDPIRCGFHIHFLFVFDDLDKKISRNQSHKYFTAVSYDRMQIRQLWLLHESHRDHSARIDILNMRCHGIACIRSFDTGLISAEGKRLECFE